MKRSWSNHIEVSSPSFSKALHNRTNVFNLVPFTSKSFRIEDDFILGTVMAESKYSELDKFGERRFTKSSLYEDDCYSKKRMKIRNKNKTDEYGFVFGYSDQRSIPEDPLNKLQEMEDYEKMSRAMFWVKHGL